MVDPDPQVVRGDPERLLAPLPDRPLRDGNSRERARLSALQQRVFVEPTLRRVGERVRREDRFEWRVMGGADDDCTRTNDCAYVRHLARCFLQGNGGSLQCDSLRGRDKLSRRREVERAGPLERVRPDLPRRVPELHTSAENDIGTRNTSSNHDKGRPSRVGTTADRRGPSAIAELGILNQRGHGGLTFASTTRSCAPVQTPERPVRAQPR